MNPKKLEYQELLKQFDNYERKFAHDIQDKFLLEFFNDFEDKLKASNFPPQQLLEIRARLERLMQIFADKKTELKKQSAEILERRDQLQRYITNSNIRK